MAEDQWKNIIKRNNMSNWNKVVKAAKKSGKVMKKQMGGDAYNQAKLATSVNAAKGALKLKKRKAKG